MAKFDSETLRELHDVREVAIRTEKHPESAVVIWVVGVCDDVYPERRLLQGWQVSELNEPAVQTVQRDIGGPDCSKTLGEGGELALLES